MIVKTNDMWILGIFFLFFGIFSGNTAYLFLGIIFMLISYTTTSKNKKRGQ